MQAQAWAFRVRPMCRVLQVSRSGFRPGSVWPGSPRRHANQALIATEARARSADAGSLRRAEEVAPAHTSRVSVISGPPQSMNLLRFSACCYRSSRSHQMRE